MQARGPCARLDSLGAFGWAASATAHTWPLESQSHNADASKSNPTSLDGSRSKRPWDRVTILILILILLHGKLGTAGPALTQHGHPRSCKFLVLRGVTWDRKEQTWRARIYYNGKQLHVGR
jgi:hypothetical protein